ARAVRDRELRPPPERLRLRVRSSARATPDWRRRQHDRRRTWFAVRPTRNCRELARVRRSRGDPPRAPCRDAQGLHERVLRTRALLPRRGYPRAGDRTAVGRARATPAA